MKIIGITGAIGCGKTTVSKIVGNLGYEVFDADYEVKKIYKNREFLCQLKNAFPRVFCGDILDKQLLRKWVFSDQNKLLILENIIEPFLEDIFLKMINSTASRQGWLFIDAVLLFEKGWNKYCDKVICVDVDLEIQKSRVIKRDCISEKEFFDIYNLQMNNKKKCELSDIVLDTNCSIDDLKVKVKKILDELKVS